MRDSRAQALSFSPGKDRATPSKEDRDLSTHASTSSAIDGKHLVTRADDSASSPDVSIRTTQGRAGLADLRPAEATVKTYDPHPRPVVVGYETGWVSAGERGPARHPTART
ncbi:hypothetical protein [Actinacidiphila glaucinigra]